MSSYHSTSSSPSSEGSAFPWILEHLLAYPGTYEIPLRTMYALNSQPQAQLLPRHSIRADTPSLSSSNGTSPDTSPASPSFPLEPHQQSLAPNTTDHFKECLMTHVSRLPSQPFSLPPSFITSFVRRCFTQDLCMVDFTQALTAMDYLKDIDTRRRRELSAALQRLGIEMEGAERSSEDISSKYPRVSQWFKDMQEKERKVEALYTQLYIGLRRWILINEMRLTPFSKANSIAMLNTLYPPQTTSPPTRQLTSRILADQRNAFFRYIQGVEKNGKQILKNLELQGKRDEDETGWPVVREIVDKYLRAANGVIEECQEVTGPDTFAERDARPGRRADSGVSFTASDRPYMSGSTSNDQYITAARPARGTDHDKILPTRPTYPPPAPPHASVAGQPSTNAPPPLPKKRGTTLEKITRELRNLRSRNDVRELDRSCSDHPNGGHAHTHSDETGASSLKPRLDQDIKERSLGRSLRKMKSTSSLVGKKHRHKRSGSGDADGTETFSIDDLRRERMIRDAQAEKANRILGR